MFCEKLRHLVNLVNVTTGKGIYKYRPFIALIIFYLLVQHPLGPSDSKACFIVSPDRDVDLVAD